MPADNHIRAPRLTTPKAMEDKARQPLPRLRVTSHSFDVSHGSIANVTQRTVSSSTSIISTPSNNIRRVQQRNGLRQNKELRPSDIEQGGNATRKLLNLQQLKKTFNPEPFVLRKPVNMTKYDYSVFSGLPLDPEAADETGLPPPIKESQIRAWESAEKISANIIFEHSTPQDGFGIYEDGAPDTSIEDDTHMGDDPETSIDRGGRSPRLPIKKGPKDLILSIPGYTKGELEVLKEQFDVLSHAASPVDPAESEEALAKALWVYRQQESTAQERAFMAHHSIAGKRKVQVMHKKEFLRKLFGYTNNVNQDFVTNNTSYSAYDNVANVQKAFHEDKEEIVLLLEENRLFEEAIAETRTRLRETTAGEAWSPLRSGQPEIPHPQLTEMTLAWLTSNYIKESEMDGVVEQALDHDDPEMVAYTIAQLKKRVREA